MTNLDLPQVSIARYLELLKRKRWQVIPLTVLGLLIGGFVAMLVPRYYVATTEVQITRNPSDTTIGTNEDPMAGLVGLALNVIPTLAGDTMRKLGWPEGSPGDLFVQQENERAVRSRLTVTDADQAKVRSLATLRLTYRDRDGKRAAEFLNTLVELWSVQQMASMRGEARDALAEANQFVDRQQTAFESISTEIRDLEQRYDLQPGLSEEESRSVLAMAAQRDREDSQSLARERLQRETLAADVARLQGELDRLPPKVPAAQALEKDLQVDPEIKELLKRIAGVQMQLKAMAPEHPQYALYDHMLKSLLEARQTLLGAAADGEVPNPAFKLKDQELQAAAGKLTLCEREIARLETTLAGAARRKEELRTAHFEYRRLRQNLDDARKQLELLQADRNRKEGLAATLDNARPIKQGARAMVPPAPTEPNILLVALFGCGIGLGAAIGLVLLLDFLRSTFKTVDDVERGLPVPVLGAIAHMESEAEARLVRRRRRTASLLGAATLLFSLTVVTIYYVEPERLPQFARDFLNLVLGDR